MAGLTAARILHDTGFAVTVLEARDRIGGRTWTDDSLGVPCDLGASWIHGADDNPLTDWAAAIGLPLVYTPTSRRRFFRAGNWQSQQDMMRASWRGVSAAALRMWFAAPPVTAQPQPRRRSATALATAIGPILDDPSLPLADRRFLAWVVSVSEGVQGAPAEYIDLAEWYPREATGVNAMPLGGYRHLVEDVAAGLDICLNCAVGLVAHDDARRHLAHAGRPHLWRCRRDHRPPQLAQDQGASCSIPRCRLPSRQPSPASAMAAMPCSTRSFCASRPLLAGHARSLRRAARERPRRAASSPTG